MSGDGAYDEDYGQDYTMWGLPHSQTARPTGRPTPRPISGETSAQLEACNERGRSGCSDLPNNIIS